MEKDKRELILRNFLLDINSLDELKKWSNSFNLFDVLRISRTEIRHSNILAWLLNSNENHNLGDSFIKHLLQNFVKHLELLNKDMMHLLLSDFYGFTVLREWRNIDILLISNKENIIIAIENKVDSKEHDNQLQRYKKILNDEYPRHKKFLFYLTPSGENPTDKDWEILTYKEIADALSDICTKTNMKSEVSLLINNYKNIVRREIMEDQELIEICTKIYFKHKEAFDLINEYSMNSSLVSNIILEELRNLSQENKVIIDNHKTNTFIRFYTNNMNKFLVNLPNKNFWGNNHPYAYEFHLSREKFSLGITLLTKDTPAEIRNQMDKIMAYEKYSSKEELGTFTNLHKTIYKISDELDSPNKIATVVKKSLKDILSWEEEILEKIS